MLYYFSNWQSLLVGEGSTMQVRPSGAELVFDFGGGRVLFRGNQTPGGAVVLGNGLDGQADLGVISTVLGSGLDVSAGNILDVLWALLTRNGDPDGVTAWKPIKPRLRDGRLRLQVAEGAVEEPFDKSNHPLVLETIRRDYGRVRGRNDASAKYLGALMRGLGLSVADVTPPGQPPEIPEPPGTVFTETFTSASKPGLTADLTWTRLWGQAWVISTNMAGFNDFPDPLGDPERCNSQVSGDDMHAGFYVRVLSGAGGGGPSGRYHGVTVRHSTSGNGLRKYEGRLYENGDVAIQRNLSSNGQSTTELARTNVLPGGSGILNKLLRISVEGSQIQAWIEDDMVLSHTDSSISSHTRGGVVGNHNGGRDDDWYLSDEFPVVASRRRSQTIVIS